MAWPVMLARESTILLTGVNGCEFGTKVRRNFPIGKYLVNSCLIIRNIPDREILLAYSPVVVENFPNGETEQAMTFIRSPQQLGDALRAARKQLGLTQPQLALAAGVGVRFIVDLEAGKPTLRLENVLRVIDALGGEVQLSGLPSSVTNDQREGGDHGA